MKGKGSKTYVPKGTKRSQIVEKFGKQVNLSKPKEVRAFNKMVKRADRADRRIDPNKQMAHNTIRQIAAEALGSITASVANQQNLKLANASAGTPNAIVNGYVTAGAGRQEEEDDQPGLANGGFN